jgi:hypothetical protein
MVNSFQPEAYNYFNINHIRSTAFNRIQQAMESGSGLGELSFWYTDYLP